MCRVMRGNIIRVKFCMTADILIKQRTPYPRPVITYLQFPRIAAELICAERNVLSENYNADASREIAA